MLFIYSAFVSVYFLESKLNGELCELCRLSQQVLTVDWIILVSAYDGDVNENVVFMLHVVVFILIWSGDTNVLCMGCIYVGTRLW